MLVLSGDHAADLGGDDRASLLDAHAASTAAATMLTIELDDPGAYGRVVRGEGGEVERVVEAKVVGRRRPGGAGDPRDQRRHLRLRRSSPGRSARRARQRQRPGRVLPARRVARRCAARATRSPPTWPDDVGVTMGVNDRVDLAAVEAEARRRILEAHMRAGVTVVDPASTWVDAGVEIAADARHRARHEPARRDEGRRRLRRRPADHADRHGARRRRRASGIPIWSSARSSTAARSAPFAYLRPGAAPGGGRQGGDLRRDQELARSGPGAKVPHLAYVGDAEIGRGQQPRRRHDHRQLRRFPQEPDCDRARRAAGR